MGVLVVIGMPAIQKILVIRLSSIGDIILTTPVLRRLHAAYPDARIDFCTKPPFVTLLSSNPRLSAIYTTEQLPGEAYDLVVDLQNNHRSRTIVRSLNAKEKVKYQKENWKKCNCPAYKREHRLEFEPQYITHGAKIQSLYLAA